MAKTPMQVAMEIPKDLFPVIVVHHSKSCDEVFVWTNTGVTFTKESIYDLTDAVVAAIADRLNISMEEAWMAVDVKRYGGKQ